MDINKPELKPSRLIMKAFVVYLIIFSVALFSSIWGIYSSPYDKPLWHLEGILTFSIPFLLVTYPLCFIVLCIFLIWEVFRVRRRLKRHREDLKNGINSIGKNTRKS